MKQMKTGLTILIAVFMLIGIAACSTTSEGAVAAATESSALATEKNAASEPTSEATPETAENPTLEPTEAPTPEPTEAPTPTPTPKPFSLGVHGEEIYRNEFLDFEINFGELGLSDKYFALGGYGIATEFTERRTSETTVESATNAILAEEKQFTELILSRGIGQGEHSVSVNLAFLKSNRSTKEEAYERYDSAQRNQNENFQCFEKATLSIGDREWLGHDFIEQYGTSYPYTRLLFFCDQGFSAQMMVIVNYKEKDPGYETAKTELDQICTAFTPVNPDTKIASGPEHRAVDVTFTVNDFTPIEEYGLHCAAASGTFRYTVDINDSKSEEVLAVKVDITSNGDSKLRPSPKRPIIINGIEFPPVTSFGSEIAGETERIIITIELDGTALAGTDPEEITEIRIPFQLDKNLTEIDYCIMTKNG